MKNLENHIASLLTSRLNSRVAMAWSVSSLDEASEKPGRGLVLSTDDQSLQPFLSAVFNAHPLQRVFLLESGILSWLLIQTPEKTGIGWKDLSKDELLRSWRLLGLLGILSVLSGQTSRAVRTPWLKSEVRSEVVRIFGDVRLIEGRLTGGFPYKEWQVPEESTSVHRRAPELVRHATSLLAKSPSAQGWADVGILQLLHGEIDAAILSLQRAAALDPTQPTFFSDLAAAYIESARQKTRPFDLLNALEMVDRALALDTNLREALFNRALALQHIRLFNRAEFAWTGFLLAEQDTGWTEEGNSQRQAVIRALEAGTWNEQRRELEKAITEKNRNHIDQIARKNPRQTRLLFENELLPRWARAVDREDRVDGTHVLVAMRYLLSAMVSLDDRLMEDVVDHIEMVERNDPQGYARTAKIILAMQHGMQLYQQTNYQKAFESFRKIADYLERVGNPLRFKALYYLACATHYLGRSDEAIRILTHLEAAAHQHSYRSLQGEVLWMKGVASLANRQPIQAQEAYSRALEIFGEFGDGETAAGVENLISELLDFQGASADAWLHRVSALLPVSEVRDPQRFYQIYTVTAIAAFRQHLPRASLEFVHEACANAQQIHNPAASANSRLWLARYYQDLGEAQATTRNLKLAWTEVKKIAPGVTRGRLESDILAIEAKLAVDPRRSLAILGEAIQRARGAKYLDNLTDLYFRRAQILRQLGEIEGAADDLEIAINLTEEWRQKIDTWSYRSDFLERERSVFDAMIDLQSEVLDRPDRAWSYIERLKGHTLMEVLASKYPGENYKIIEPKTLARNLPEGTSVVTFRSTPKELCSWALNRDGLHFGGCHNSGSLEGRIRSLREALQDNRRSEAKRVGAELYDLLISPIQPFLQEGGRLVVVPDGELYEVPFGALIAQGSGRYLIENYSIVMAPSAGFYLATIRRILHRTPTKRMLVVGDANIDRNLFANLPSLKRSRDEALEVAGLYPYSSILIGANATKSSVLRHLPSYSIVHFAVHAVLNYEAPAWSLLALSPDARGHQSSLYSWEIGNLSLPNMALAVLPICGSSAGVHVGIEGEESISRAFLSAGIPTVIAALWNVNDSLPRWFMLELYRKIGSGKDIAEALRAVQVEAIRRGESSKIWAAFGTEGASQNL